MNNSAASQPDHRSHLTRLDVLRGVAILSVFLYHFYDQILDVATWHWKGLVLNPGNAPSGWAYALYPLTFGWAGVALFFVISGLVIHLSFLRSRAFRVRQFYARRFWRIYPPYLLALCVWAAREHRDAVHPVSSAQFLSHLLLVHNMRQQWIFAIVPAFWSLALEAQFYLVYPLLLAIRQRVGMARTLWLTLGLSLCCRLVAGLFIIDWHGPLNPVVLRAVPVLWFDWTLGAYVAEQFYAGRRAFTGRSFTGPRYVGSMVLLLLVLASWFKPTDLLSYSLASVLAALAIDSYLWCQRPLSRLETALVPLGLCSYSFYLWHQPLMTFLATALHHLGLPHRPLVDLSLALPIVFILTFGYSWLLYRSVEQWSIMVSKRLTRPAAPPVLNAPP